MIEVIKDVREVTEFKETVIGEIMKCDVCGKVIYNTKYDKNNFTNRQHWWGLVTGHNDWGNDSCDSIESFEICSPECLNKKLQRVKQLL